MSVQSFIINPLELKNSKVSRELTTALLLDSASGVQLSNLQVAELQHLDYRDPVEGYTNFIDDLKNTPKIESYVITVPDSETDTMELKLHCISGSKYIRMKYTFHGDCNTQLTPMYRMITTKYLYKLN
jgi:hypothetical protein